MAARMRKLLKNPKPITDPEVIDEYIEDFVPKNQSATQWRVRDSLWLMFFNISLIVYSQEVRDLIYRIEWTRWLLFLSVSPRNRCVKIPYAMGLLIIFWPSSWCVILSMIYETLWRPFLRFFAPTACAWFHWSLLRCHCWPSSPACPSSYYPLLTVWPFYSLCSIHRHSRCVISSIPLRRGFADVFPFFIQEVC